MYINNVLYCFYSSDTEAFEACFRLLHDDDDVTTKQWRSIVNGSFMTVEGLSCQYFDGTNVSCD